MDKNILVVVAIAIFIWVSWYIELCDGETQKMLGAIWRTFLTMTHLEKWILICSIQNNGERRTAFFFLGVVMQRKVYVNMNTVCCFTTEILGHPSLCHEVLRGHISSFSPWRWNDTTALSGSTAIQCHCGFLWRTSDRQRKKCFVLVLSSFVLLFICLFCATGKSAKCLKYINVTPPDPFPLCVSLAVWTAVTWAMTAMRPTLAAYPACLTAHRLSPGATASPALDSKRAMPRLPREDTRGVRLLPSTRPIRCQPAAPAASAARLALSSSKGWTLRTSSLVTWVTVTF